MVYVMEYVWKGAYKATTRSKVLQLRNLNAAIY